MTKLLIFYFSVTT